MASTIEEYLELIRRSTTPLPDEQISILADMVYRRHREKNDKHVLMDGFVSTTIDRGSTREMPEPPGQGNALVEHHDLNIQKAAFEFFLLDDRVERELVGDLDCVTNWVSIPGIGRGFFFYQVVAAFIAVMRERGTRRGAILTDEIGLGKVSFPTTARATRLNQS